MQEALRQGKRSREVPHSGGHADKRDSSQKVPHSDEHAAHGTVHRTQEKSYRNDTSQECHFMPEIPSFKCLRQGDH